MNTAHEKDVNSISKIRYFMSVLKQLFVFILLCVLSKTAVIILYAKKNNKWINIIVYVSICIRTMITFVRKFQWRFIRIKSINFYRCRTKCESPISVAIEGLPRLPLSDIKSRRWADGRRADWWQRARASENRRDDDREMGQNRRARGIRACSCLIYL